MEFVRHNPNQEPILPGHARTQWSGTFGSLRADRLNRRRHPEPDLRCASGSRPGAAKRAAEGGGLEADAQRRNDQPSRRHHRTPHNVSQIKSRRLQMGTAVLQISQIPNTEQRGWATLTTYFCRYAGVTVLSAVGKAPPQHLVRSTGTAMSTTGSHGVRAAQRPPSQFACTLAPVGNSHPRLRNRANVSLPDKVRRLAALTNGTVRPNAKCCAGLCKASSPARRALCQSPIAWQSPVPNPSIPRPS